MHCWPNTVAPHSPRKKGLIDVFNRETFPTNKQDSKTIWYNLVMNDNQKRFLATLAALLAKMAKADGAVTDDERELISNAWRRMGLTQEQCEYCAAAFKMAQDDGVPINRYVKEFVSTQFAIYTRAFLYDLMWDVACADGVLHPHEKSILSAIPETLGLPHDSFDMGYARHIGTHRLIVDQELEDEKRKAEEARRKREEERKRKEAEEAARKQREAEAARRRAQEEARKREGARRQTRINTPSERLRIAYEILGCAASASDTEVRVAYRKAAMRWHPDKLRMDGVPEELVKNANEKMAAINDAWNTIKQSRKIK